MTQVSRWFVMPMLSMSRGPRLFATSSSVSAPSCEDKMSRGVVLDPSRLRVKLRERVLRDVDDAARAVHEHRARRRGALVERDDVFLTHD